MLPPCVRAEEIQELCATDKHQTQRQNSTMKTLQHLMMTALAIFAITVTTTVTAKSNEHAHFGIKSNMVAVHPDTPITVTMPTDTWNADMIGLTTTFGLTDHALTAFTGIPATGPNAVTTGIGIHVQPTAEAGYGPAQAVDRVQGE